MGLLISPSRSLESRKGAPLRVRETSAKRAAIEDDGARVLEVGGRSRFYGVWMGRISAPSDWGAILGVAQIDQLASPKFN